MRSFAVVAGFAAAVNAYAYPAVNTTSVAPPSYQSSPAPYYPVSQPSYGYTTKVVTGTTTVCSVPGTYTIATKTYIVTKSTTIIDNDCVITTTVPVKPSSTPAKVTTPVSVRASSTPVVTVSSKPVTPPVVIVSTPARNATTVFSTGRVPSSTRPPVSQFTGAAVAGRPVEIAAILGGLAAALL